MAWNTKIFPKGFVILYCLKRLKLVILKIVLDIKPDTVTSPETP